MAYGDTTRKAEAQGVAVASINVTHNSSVAGNLLVAGCSSFSGGSGTQDPITVTDGGNTWTHAGTAVNGTGSSAQAAGISVSVLGTGGNRTVNFNPASSNTHDFSAYTHEFTGPHATPVSGTAVEASAASGSTTADSGSFTPADADCLYVAVLGHTATGTVSENQSPGNTNWTLSNEHESGSSAEPGSMVFFIHSGSAAARRAVWSIPSSGWATVIAGFKPAGAAALPFPPLFHRKQVPLFVGRY